MLQQIVELLTWDSKTFYNMFTDFLKNKKNIILKTLLSLCWFLLFYKFIKIRKSCVVFQMMSYVVKSYKKSDSIEDTIE